MHRIDKFKALLWRLEKQGKNTFTTPQIIGIMQDEFKVTSQTASRYLEEMVLWKLMDQDGFTFTNIFCKEEIK